MNTLDLSNPYKSKNNSKLNQYNQNEHKNILKLSEIFKKNTLLMQLTMLPFLNPKEIIKLNRVSKNT